MAITFVAEAHGSTSYGSSITVSVPAGVVNNDVMIAVVGGTRSGAPAGWTLIGSANSGTSSLGTVYIYYRVASSEPGSYTFSLSGAWLACAGIAAYRGVNTTTPVDTTNFNVSAVGATSNFNTSSITAGSNQWLFTFASGYEFGTASTRTFSEGTGTERADLSITNSASPDNTNLEYTDSNGTVASGSVSRTQTRSAAASGGVSGAILLNAANTSGSATPTQAAVTATALNAVQAVGAQPSKASVTAAAFGPTVFAGHFVFVGTATVSVGVPQTEMTGRAAVTASAFSPAQIFFGTPTWRQFIVDPEVRIKIPTDTRTVVIEAAT